MRARTRNVTVLTLADDPEMEKLAERWFTEWTAEITFRSGNTGCGCCVDSWDIICSEAAAAALPEEISCVSAWSEPEFFRPRPLEWLRDLICRIF